MIWKIAHLIAICALVVGLWVAGTFALWVAFLQPGVLLARVLIGLAGVGLLLLAGFVLAEETK